MSSVPYDGYEFPRALESMAACGVTHVEPAFIIGYSGPIDDSDFSAGKARQYAAWLADSGIGCYAFSAHNIQFDRADVVDIYRGRMDFAAGMGAKIINVTAAARADSARYFRHIDTIARHAEQLGIMIGLENPGDGQDNLFNTAADGIALLEKLGHPCIKLNYDAGNTISHRPAAGARRGRTRCGRAARHAVLWPCSHQGCAHRSRRPLFLHPDRQGRHRLRQHRADRRQDRSQFDD